MAKRENVRSYINNLGKSLKYVATATMSDAMPALSRTVDQNRSLVESGISYTRNFMNTKGQLSTDNAGLLNNLLRDVNTAKTNAFKAIRTGSIKDFDKEAESLLESMGIDMDMGGWGDDSGGSDMFDLSEDEEINSLSSSAAAIRTSAKVNEVGSNLRTKAVMNAVVDSSEQSANHIVNSSARLHSISMTASAQMHTETVQLLGNTNTLLSSLVSFHTNEVSNHMSKQLSFFDNVLDELRGIKSAIAPENNNRPNRDTAIEEILGGGSFNLKGYMEQIKKNFQTTLPNVSMISSMASSMANMGKELGMSPLQRLKNEPLAFAVDMLGANLLPKTMRDSLGKLDSSFSGFMSTIALKLNAAKNDMSKSDSGLFNKSILASLLGIDINPNTKIDPSKYNREAVQFTGKTDKAITEVIPSLLSNILSAITGSDKTAIFDYSTGKFTSSASVIQDHKERIRSSRLSGMESTRGELKRSLSSMPGGGSKAVEDDLDSFMEFLSSYDGVYDPKKHTSYDQLSVSGLRLSDPRMYNLFRAAYSNMSPHSRFRANDNILRSRVSASNTARSIEDELHEQGLSMAYSNIADALSPGKGKASPSRTSSSSTGGSGSSPSGGGNIDPELEELLTKPYDEMKSTIKSFGESGKISDDAFKKPSFFSRLLNEKNLIKRVKMIKDSISKPGELLGGLVDKMDSVLYRIIYGDKDSGDGDDDGDPSRRKNSLFGRISSWVNSSMNKSVKFMDMRILSPIHEKFFGEDGLFTKFMKQFEPFLDKMKDMTKTGLTRFGKFLLGNNQTHDGFYTGGALSDVANMVLDFGNSMRHTFTGGAYKKSDGTQIGSTDNNIMKYMKTYSSSLMDTVKDGLLGEQETIVNPDGTVSLKRKGDGLFNETLNSMKGSLTVVKELFTTREGETPEDVAKSVDIWRSEMKGFLPKGIAGGLAGGAASLLLPGGPLLWGLLGSTAAFASHSSKFREKLFGTEEEEGIIPKRYVDGFKKYFPSMAAGGALGLGAGMILPGAGLLGTMALGATVGYVKKSETAQRYLFGDETKDGLLPRDMKEKLKKYIPSIGAGGILGAGVGTIVGSPLLGMKLGAALGYVQKSDRMKEMLFGKEDEDGNVISKGRIPRSIINTFKKFAPSLKVGGALGLASSFLLPGGPLFWITMSTALAHTKKAKTVQDALFGKGKEEDDTDEGFANSVKSKFGRLLPSGAKGAFFGALAGGLGILGPAGPVMGALIGSTVTISGISDRVKKMFFGDKDDGDDKKGLIDGIKERFSKDGKTPKHLIATTIGALSGGLGLMGPAGPVMGAVIGASMSITGIGDRVKNIIFGKNKDESDYSDEGILGEFNESVTDTIGDATGIRPRDRKKKGIWGLMGTIGKFLWRQSTDLFIKAPLIVAGGIKDATLDITKALFDRAKFEAKFLIKRIGESVKEGVSYLWERSVKFPFVYVSSKLKDWLEGPIKDIGSWIGNKFKQYIGNPIANAFKNMMSVLFGGDGDGSKDSWSVRLARFLAGGIRRGGRDIANVIRGPLGELPERESRRSASQRRRNKDVNERTIDAVQDLGDDISPRIDKTNSLLDTLIRVTMGDDFSSVRRPSRLMRRGGRQGVVTDSGTQDLNKTAKTKQAAKKSMWSKFSGKFRRMGRGSRLASQQQINQVISEVSRTRSEEDFDSTSLGLQMQSTIATIQTKDAINNMQSGGGFLDKILGAGGWLGKMLGPAGIITTALVGLTALSPLLGDLVGWFKGGGFSDAVSNIVKGVMGLGEREEDRTYVDEEGEEQFVANDSFRESLGRAGVGAYNKAMGKKVMPAVRGGSNFMTNAAGNLGQAARATSAFLKDIPKPKALTDGASKLATSAVREKERFVRAFNEVLDKFFKNKHVAKMIGSDSKAAAALRKVSDFIKSIMTSEFIAKWGPRLLVGTAKTVGKGALAFMTGGISVATFAAWDSITGAIEAKNILMVQKDSDISIRMRAAAAIVKALAGFAPIISILSEIVAEQFGVNLKKDVATIIHSLIAPDEISELSGAQDSLRSEWETSGSELSFEAWNDLQNKTTVRRMVDSFDTVVGGTTKAVKTGWNATTGLFKNIGSGIKDAFTSDSGGFHLPGTPQWGKGPGSTYFNNVPQSNILSVVPHISQSNPLVSGLKFGRTGNDTIGDSGCAPAVAAMAISAITGEHVSMTSLANIAATKGFKKGFGGTNPAFFKHLETMFNIRVTELGSGSIVMDIVDALKNKKLVILMGGGPNNPMGEVSGGRSKTTPFGDTPHYVLAIGYNGRRDEIFINDPLSSKGNEVYQLSSTLGTTTKAFIIEAKGSSSVSSPTRSTSGLGAAMFGRGGSNADLSREFGYALNAPQSDFTTADLRKVKEYSQKYGVDPHLWLALVETESSFNSKARSSSNALGWGQVVESTAKWLYEDKVKLGDNYNHERMGFDKDANMQMSMYYLGDLMRRLGPEKGIMAYNVGEGTIRAGKYKYKNENASTYLSKIKNNLQKNTGKNMSGIQVGNYTPGTSSSPGGSTNMVSGLAGIIGEVGSHAMSELSNAIGFDAQDALGLFSRLGEIVDPFASIESMMGSESSSGSYQQFSGADSDVVNAIYSQYRVTSNYGNRKDPFNKSSSFHTGIDLVKAHRSPIASFTDGRVIYSSVGTPGSGYNNYGNVVAVKDRKGYTHLYAHLDERSVRVGDNVKPGQILGLQGSTGRSTGSHLHYEVRRQGYGTHVDPTKYLEEYLGLSTGASTGGRMIQGAPSADPYVTRVDEALNRFKGGEMYRGDSDVIKLLAMIAEGIQSLVGITDQTRSTILEYLNAIGTRGGSGGGSSVIIQSPQSNANSTPLSATGQSRKGDKTKAIQAIVAGVTN